MENISKTDTNIYKFILTHSSRRLVPWSLSSVLRSVAVHTPWPKVTVYYMVARNKRWERKGPQIPFRGMPPSKRFHHHLSTGPHGQPNLQDMGLWDWNQLSVVPGSGGKGIKVQPVWDTQGPISKNKMSVLVQVKGQNPQNHSRTERS